MLDSFCPPVYNEYIVYPRASFLIHGKSWPLINTDSGSSALIVLTDPSVIMQMTTNDGKHTQPVSICLTEHREKQEIITSESWLVQHGVTRYMPVLPVTAVKWSGYQSRDTTLPQHGISYGKIFNCFV